MGCCLPVTSRRGCKPRSSEHRSRPGRHHAAAGRCVMAASRLDLRFSACACLLEVTRWSCSLAAASGSVCLNCPGDSPPTELFWSDQSEEYAIVLLGLPSIRTVAATRHARTQDEPLNGNPELDDVVLDRSCALEC